MLRSTAGKRGKRSKAGNAKRSGAARRRQLVEIAFNEIAGKGFEGLRFQEVAENAGVNNATLYHYFPTKEALIQGVVDYLGQKLRAPRPARRPAPSNALDELRLEFEATADLVAHKPHFFIVITELALRAKRDPTISKINRKRDHFWRDHLTGILERGIAQGVFRRDIDIPIAVIAIMVQLKGICHHAAMAKRKPGEVKKVTAEIAAQVEQRLAARKSKT